MVYSSVQTSTTSNQSHSPPESLESPSPLINSSIAASNTLGDIVWVVEWALMLWQGKELDHNITGGSGTHCLLSWSSTSNLERRP